MEVVLPILQSRWDISSSCIYSKLYKIDIRLNGNYYRYQLLAFEWVHQNWIGSMLLFLVHHIFSEIFLLPPPAVLLIEINLPREPYIHCEKMISCSDSVKSL